MDTTAPQRGPGQPGHHPSAAPRDVPASSIDEAVASYIRPHGFPDERMRTTDSTINPGVAQTSEMAFDQTCDAQTHATNLIRTFNPSHIGAEQYEEQYTKLQKWVDQSASICKVGCC